MSENTASDGARTTMTSFMDTDDDIVASPALDTATTSEPDSDDNDTDYDTVSIYPVSRYPQVSLEHRTEAPYSGVGMRRDESDM
jgi:hypothetical protein